MRITVRSTQKGIALVVVLLVVALVSIIATDITGNLQREIRRSANIFDYQQAKYYALGAEKFAIAILQQNSKDSPSRDDLAQGWATQGLYFPVEGGDLTGIITDVNSCFNLNSLVEYKEEKGYISNRDSMPQKVYRQLLIILGLEEGLADSLTDWIDSDESVSGMEGAEDLEYERLSPAYRAANNLIVDISELRLIQGYSADVVKKLQPYVCALPQADYLQININTIDKDKPELLLMMINELSLENARQILAERSSSGYDDLASFWKLEALAGLEIDSKKKAALQLDSDYYILHAKAKIGRGNEGLTTLFKQNKKKIHIIWRRFGKLEQLGKTQ